MREVDIVYGSSPKKPSKISDAVKNLKLDIKKFTERNVTFICEIPSLTCIDSLLSVVLPDLPYVLPWASNGIENQHVDICAVLARSDTALKEAYQICRKKATEVLVWLISDTDRIWNAEIPHAVPIAYAMKGYSLSCNIMQKMMDHVLQSCHDRGIHVACSTFDGQWLRLATQSTTGKPLTRLAVHKSVWAEAMKTRKNQMLDKMSALRLIENAEDIADHPSITLTRQDGKLHVSCRTLQYPIHKLLNQTTVTTAKSIETDHTQDVLHEDPHNEQDDQMNCLPDAALELMQNDGIILTASSEVPNDAEPNQNENTENDDDVVREAVQEQQCLPQEKYDELLLALRTVRPSRWQNFSAENVKHLTSTAENLQTLTVKELDVITDVIGHRKDIKKSWNKLDKTNALSYLIGDKSNIQKEKSIPKMKSLAYFAAAELVKPRQQFRCRPLPKTCFKHCLCHCCISKQNQHMAKGIYYKR